MRTLVIAERFNLGDGVTWPAAERCLERRKYDKWLYHSHAIGAYGSGMTMQTQMRSVGRRKLLSIGLPSDFDALNLLPPGPCGAWDIDLAARIALELRWLIVYAHDEPKHFEEDDCELGDWRYDRLVLVGKRVALAMELGALRFFERHGGAIVVPHPSGRNTWWNDPLNVSAGRRAMEEFFDE
jgi:hypothetical protein